MLAPQQQPDSFLKVYELGALLAPHQFCAESAILLFTSLVSINRQQLSKELEWHVLIDDVPAGRARPHGAVFVPLRLLNHLFQAFLQYDATSNLRFSKGRRRLRKWNRLHFGQLWRSHICKD